MTDRLKGVVGETSLFEAMTEAAERLKDWYVPPPKPFFGLNRGGTVHLVDDVVGHGFIPPGLDADGFFASQMRRRAAWAPCSAAAALATVENMAAAGLIAGEDAAEAALLLHSTWKSVPEGHDYGWNTHRVALLEAAGRLPGANER